MLVASLTESTQHGAKHFRYTLLIVIWLCAISTSALEISSALTKYVTEKFGVSSALRLQEWEELSRSGDGLTDLEKLELVNNFFNRTHFISDQEHWGQEDYWATPVELLVTNGGDCEDYSIAKYFTLKDMGVDISLLKIVYVKAVELNQAHMVLAYHGEDRLDPLILDNLISEIKPSSERQDLIPVYSFNGEGLWLSKLRGQEGKRIGKPDQIESWNKLMTRHEKLMR